MKSWRDTYRRQRQRRPRATSNTAHRRVLRDNQWIFSFCCPTASEWEAFLQRRATSGTVANNRTASAADKELTMSRSWRDTYAAGFLKAADIPLEGRTVRLDAVTEETIVDGERPKLVATLHDGGRWVLNSTCCQALEAILGTPDPDAWVKSKVVIYRDPTVRGPSGQVVGGIRVRAAAKPAAAAATTKRPPAARPVTRPAPEFQDAPDQAPFDVDDPDADLE